MSELQDTITLAGFFIALGLVFLGFKYLVPNLKDKWKVYIESIQPLRPNCLLTRKPIAIECETEAQNAFWSGENTALRILRRHGYEVQLILRASHGEKKQSLHYLTNVNGPCVDKNQILDQAIAFAEVDYLNTI